MDKQFYWLHNRIHQWKFYILLVPNGVNLTDYFTKNHALIHHLHMGLIFLLPASQQQTKTTENIHCSHTRFSCEGVLNFKSIFKQLHLQRLITHWHTRAQYTG